MARAVRCSPPTAGVPSLCLGHSMCVSWWKKWSLGRFFLGFLPFSPAQISFHHFSLRVSPIFPYHKFYSAISPHSFILFRFHFIYPSVGTSDVVGGFLAVHRFSVKGFHRISSLDLALCWIRVEDIYFILILLLNQTNMEGGTEWHLPKSDDWHRRVRR